MAEVRDIIEIDQEKCTGCGLCVPACAEGALQIVDGKAKLIKDLYCDGLGACLGECPEGALRVITREADPFDEQAVEELLSRQGRQGGGTADPQPIEPLRSGCPGSAAVSLEPAAPAAGAAEGQSQASGLGHFPVKLALLSPQAPFLQNADLLLLADCTAACYPDLHQKLLPAKAVAMACPKLDDAEAHIRKLASVLETARPKSLTVAIMEVPCCRGLMHIAQQAVKRAGYAPETTVMVVGRQGQIMDRRAVNLDQAA
jgi:Pyruvate/2-oxoacid:ferredoxin oxidoreductase delta subunit